MNTILKSLAVFFLLSLFILAEISFSTAKEIPNSGQETPETIESLRNKINTIDSEIVALLNERAEAAVQIGKLKEKEGLQVYNPEREKVIEEKLKRDNPGPLSDSAVIKIYREIISACRNIQY